MEIEVETDEQDEKTIKDVGREVDVLCVDTELIGLG